MVSITPNMVQTLVDAVVKTVSKIIDKRLKKDTEGDIDTDEVRQILEAVTTTLNNELSQIREAIASRPTTEDLESTIRDLESRIRRALVVQAVGIVGMVAVLLWALG